MCQDLSHPFFCGSFSLGKHLREVHVRSNLLIFFILSADKVHLVGAQRVFHKKKLLTQPLGNWG